MADGMAAKLRQRGPELARFAFVGGAATLVHAAIYSALVSWTAIHPQAANLLAFASALGVSLFGHHHVTFRTAEGKRSLTASSWRLGVAAVLGYLLNAFFVYLVANVIAADARLAIIPMILVTPLVTYAINRSWVFYARSH